MQLNLRVLVLTQELPVTPRNGAQHYSNAIIRALGKIVKSVDCAVLRGDKFDEFQDQGVRFISFAKISKLDFLANLSFLPRMVQACLSLKLFLFILTNRDKYDIFLIDHFAASGVAFLLPKKKTILVNHNDEAISKSSFLKFFKPGFIKLVHCFDYYKIYWYQKFLNAYVCRVSFISMYEYRSAPKAVSGKSYLIEPFSSGESGFYHLNVKKKTIVAIVGTFHWTPKKLALRRLITAYASLAEPKFTLRVAGQVADSERQDILDLPNVELVENFEKPVDVLADARVGLLVDGSGGGFKMKFFDYIDNHCIIYSLREDVVSDVMADSVNCRIFDSLEDLLFSLNSEVENSDFYELLKNNAENDFKQYRSSLHFDNAVLNLISGVL